MSALYGSLTPDRGKQVTRTAHRSISAVAKTWVGQVEVDLTKDGGCSVTARHLRGLGRITLFRGNIDEMWQEDEPRPTVTIEVKGGVATYSAPDWLNVVLIDHDMEEYKLARKEVTGVTPE